jgi:hypothetical protein
MSIFITDVWPKRGQSFIRVESRDDLAEFPYDSPGDRDKQVRTARAFAAERSKCESLPIVDDSGLTHLPVFPAATLVCS